MARELEFGVSFETLWVWRDKAGGGLLRYGGDVSRFDRKADALDFVQHDPEVNYSRYELIEVVSWNYPAEISIRGDVGSFEKKQWPK